MRVLSPDACGSTRRHQRIHACAECHGARVLKRPQGTRGLQYCNEHPLALRTECSTTPKWRSVIPSAYMHVSPFTPHQCSFVCAKICDNSVFNHMRVLSPDACGSTRRHQRIHACAECHGARVLKRPQGTRALQYCNEHPLALRTECSTTPNI